MKSALFVLPFLPLLLAACGDPISEEELAEASEGPVETPAAVDPVPEPVLLTPGTIEESLRRQANLTGELACTFRRADDDSVILAAAANIVSAESAEALIVLDGEPVELEMDGGGGFNTLSRGASFTGPDELTAEVSIRSEAPVTETPAPSIASPQYEAQLMLERGEQSLTIDGIYDCDATTGS